MKYELKHSGAWSTKPHKYVKKMKSANGTWRYYYKQDLPGDIKYGNENDKQYGRYVDETGNHTLEYRKSNKILGGLGEGSRGDLWDRSSKTVYDEGKIERATKAVKKKGSDWIKTVFK